MIEYPPTDIVREEPKPNQESDRQYRCAIISTTVDEAWRLQNDRLVHVRSGGLQVLDKFSSIPCLLLNSPLILELMVASAVFGSWFCQLHLIRCYVYFDNFCALRSLHSCARPLIIIFNLLY